MKLKFKRTCSLKDGVVEAGALVDVDDEIAHSLIAMGRAEKHTGESEKKKKGKS